VTKKYQICHHHIRFFQAESDQNPFSAPDPAGGAYDAPPDALVGWGVGILPPHSPFIVTGLFLKLLKWTGTEE